MYKRKVVKNDVTFDNAVEGLNDVVGSTYGPGGRSVLIERKSASPFITKDGVTVSRNYNPVSNIERLPVDIIKESAERTLRNAGDGTTTTTLIACAMYRIGMLKRKNLDMNVYQYANGMRSAMADVVGTLDSLSTKINCTSEVLDVAMISTNGDRELSSVIADAFNTVGADGIIIGEEYSGSEDLLEMEQGYSFDEGYANPVFINNVAKRTVEYDDAYVLVLENRVNSIQQIEKILMEVKKTGKPLVIISREFDNSVPVTLGLNHRKGVLPVVLVTSPGVGEDKVSNIRDIAAYCGAVSVNSSEGTTFRDLMLEHLGRASKVLITDRNTTIIRSGEETPECKVRKDNLIITLEHHNPSDFEKIKIRKRLGKLNGAVAKVLLSANSNSEFREKKDRFDDAIEACRVALKDGTVAGSTASLLYASMVIRKSVDSEVLERAGKSFTAGYYSVLDSIVAPTVKLLQNCGHSLDNINKFLEAIQEMYDTGENFGYGFTINPFTMELSHMSTSKVIDPVTVLKESVINSVSTASTLLTTDYSLTIVE